MAALTDEAFEGLLDDDLAWRRIELRALLSAVRRAASESASSPATRALSRSLVTMLYAHWEGFAKCTFDHYAQLVLKRRPTVKTANDSLAMAHGLHLLQRLRSGEDAARQELLSVLRDGDVPRIKLPKQSLSDTKSNLRYAVLSDILRTFGAPVTDFETKANLIDVLLCDRRNAVAHGREAFYDADTVAELHDEVIGLMELIRSLAVAQVRAKGYLAA